MESIILKSAAGNRNKLYENSHNKRNYDFFLITTKPGVTFP